MKIFVAVVVWLAACSCQPSDAVSSEVLYDRAITQLRRGEIENSLRSLSAAGLAEDAHLLHDRHRILQGRLLLLQGEIEQAQRIIRSVETYAPNVPSVSKLRRHIQNVARRRDNAYQNHAVGRYVEAYNELVGVLKECQRSVPLLLLFADCAVKLSLFHSVRNAASSVLHLEPTNIKAIALLADALYETVGAPDLATQLLQRCLRMAPDDEECLSRYFRIKAILVELETLEVDMNNKRWGASVEHATKLIELDPRGPLVALAERQLCTATQGMGVPKAGDAVKWCTNAIEKLWKQRNDEGLVSDEVLVQMLAQRGIAYVYMKNLDRARFDLKQAQAMLPGNAKVKEFQQLYEKHFKQKEEEERVDYYDILGVLKNATIDVIKKAYRKLAMQFHPDKNPEEGAEAMFRKIAEAYNILSDERLRQKFDSGGDVREDTVHTDNGMKYTYDQRDVKADGTAKAWAVNNEGERVRVEVNLKKEEPQPVDPCPKHRCMRASEQFMKEDPPPPQKPKAPEPTRLNTTTYSSSPNNVLIAEKHVNLHNLLTFHLKANMTIVPLEEDKPRHVKEGGDTSGGSGDKPIPGSWSTSDLTDDDVGNSFIYVKWIDEKRPKVVVQEGDVLEYELLWECDEDNLQLGLDFRSQNGQTLRNSPAVDQNNATAHPSTDLSKHACNQWYNRAIPLPKELQGAISDWYFVCENNLGGELEGAVRNIRLTKDGKPRIVVVPHSEKYQS